MRCLHRCLRAISGSRTESVTQATATGIGTNRIFSRIRTPREERKVRVEPCARVEFLFLKIHTTCHSPPESLRDGRAARSGHSFRQKWGFFGTRGFFGLQIVAVFGGLGFPTPLLFYIASGLNSVSNDGESSSSVAVVFIIGFGAVAPPRPARPSKSRGRGDATTVVALFSTVADRRDDRNDRDEHRSRRTTSSIEGRPLER